MYSKNSATFLRSIFPNYKFKERFNFFLNNANISGLRFLTKGYGPGGRIFWLIALIISFGGMLKIFQLTAERFYSDYVSIGIDTSYLNWINIYPAVSLCLIRGRKFTNNITEFLVKYNSSYKSDKSYSRTLINYMFITPNTMGMTTSDCEGYNSTCGVDWNVIRDYFLPKHCSAIMSNVYFAGKYYENCEELFKYRETEMGACFIANSIVDYNLDITKVPMKYSHSSKNRKLKLNYKNSDVYVLAFFIHSPEELPFFNTASKVVTSSLFIYNVEEMINEDGVEKLSIIDRDCRFPYEKLPNSSFHYSFSTCMSELRVKLELENCNCTLPTSPKKYKEFYCTIEGLECLSKVNINQKAKHLNENEETRCMDSCVKQRISEVGEVKKNTENVTSMEVELINVPHIRYVRQIAKTSLDLVVAIGGIAGLFFGASIINIGEIIYIFFIRKF